MIIHRPNQLKELSIQRVSSLPYYAKKQYENIKKNDKQVEKEIQRRKSASILDSKTLKQKMALIFKNEQLRKSQNDMYSTTYNMAKKKLKESLRISTHKKKLRQVNVRRSIDRQKMEIISNDSIELNNSAFKIEEIKIKKKSGYKMPVLNQQMFKHENNSFYKVLAVGKNRTIYQKFGRKPSLPPRYIDPHMNITNNFLVTRRNFKPKSYQEEIIMTQRLEPWSKMEEQPGFSDFP